MVCMTLPLREADSNFQFPATVSFVKLRYSSFFCREGADVALSVPLKSGTTSSNPLPSSGESTSRGILSSHGEKPAFRAGVRARQVQRDFERAQAMLDWAGLNAKSRSP